MYGVGPVGAALILGHAGDPRRFKSRNHFASYNATAPIEASSGLIKRHRLNPRGNRQINHAVRIAAITQIRNATPGRVYYDRKVAEGKSRKEALRALKRKISDAANSSPTPNTDHAPGRTTRDDSHIQRDRHYTLITGASDKSLPDPTQTYAHHRRGASTRPRTAP